MPAMTTYLSWSARKQWFISEKGENSTSVEMATHSSVLAWRIPGTGEPGGLPSMGSQSWTRLKRLAAAAAEGLNVISMKISPFNTL